MAKKRLGQRLIESLTEFRDALRSGKPMKQTIVRRMKVKGKDVFTHETFTGPIQRFRRKKP